MLNVQHENAQKWHIQCGHALRFNIFIAFYIIIMTYIQHSHSIHSPFIHSYRILVGSIVTELAVDVHSIMIAFVTLHARQPALLEWSTG